MTARTNAPVKKAKRWPSERPRAGKRGASCGCGPEGQRHPCFLKSLNADELASLFRHPVQRRNPSAGRRGVSVVRQEMTEKWPRKVGAAPLVRPIGMARRRLCVGLLWPATPDVRELLKTGRPSAARSAYTPSARTGGAMPHGKSLTMSIHPHQPPPKRPPEPTCVNIGPVLLDALRIRIATGLAHMSRNMLATGLTRLSRQTIRLADAVAPAYLKDAHRSRE